MMLNEIHRTDAGRGYLTALGSAIFLSTTTIFIRHLTQVNHLPALILAFWRDFFVVVTLLIVLGVFQRHLLRVKSKNLPFLFVYGIVLAAFNSLWTFSVALNGAAVATVLVYSSAGFTALLGWWLLKEHLGWVKLTTVALCLGGCMLVSGVLNITGWNANLAGILTGFFSGLSYAGYSLMGKTASERGISPWTTLIYTFGFAAIVFLVINLLPCLNLPGTASRPMDLFWLDKDFTAWSILFLLAAIPTVAGFGLYNVSLTILSSSVTNLIVTTEPVFTAVLAYFLFGERLTTIQLLGSAIILVGVVFLRIFEDRYLHLIKV